MPLRKPYVQYAPTRGGLITMVHKSIVFADNNTKLPTPIELTPYLQLITISNKPLNPTFILHIYIPTHEEDKHLIPLIYETIELTINNHPTHSPILVGDFNQDIFLNGRTTQHNTIAPSRDDWD